MAGERFDEITQAEIDDAIRIVREDRMYAMLAKMQTPTKSEPESSESTDPADGDGKVPPAKKDGESAKPDKPRRRSLIWGTEVED